MYKYTRLTAQPFKLRFLFKPSNTKLPDAETIWAEPGSVHVQITVNNIMFEPCDTGIKTTFGNYERRSLLRPSDEMKAVTEEIQKFVKLLYDAHTYLETRMNPMDGPSMMRIAEELRTSTSTI